MIGGHVNVHWSAFDECAEEHTPITSEKHALYGRGSRNPLRNTSNSSVESRNNYYMLHHETANGALAKSSFECVSMQLAKLYADRWRRAPLCKPYASSSCLSNKIVQAAIIVLCNVPAPCLWKRNNSYATISEREMSTGCISNLLRFSPNRSVTVCHGSRTLCNV